MKQLPCVRIGHLSIIDHLVLGIACKSADDDTKPLNSCRIQSAPAASWEQLREDFLYGEIDAAFMTIPMAMQFSGEGMDIRLLMFVHRAGSVVVKTNEKPLKHMADFKNKTILIPSEFSVCHMLLHRLFSSAGICLGTDETLADVYSEAAFPFLMPEILASGAEGQVAGFCAPEPHAARAVREKNAKVLCTTDNLWRYHPCSAFVVREKLLRQLPEQIDEIVALFYDSAEKLHTSIQSTALAADISETATAFLDIDHATLTDCLEKSGVCFDPGLLAPDMNALKTIMDYMHLEMNVLTQAVDLDQLVDDNCILNILPERIH